MGLYYKASSINLEKEGTLTISLGKPLIPVVYCSYTKKV